jgi:peptide/nickel transport system permease protein
MARLKTVRRMFFGETSEFSAIWTHLKEDKPAMFGLVLIIVLIAVALSADYISPYDPNAQDLSMRLQGVSWTHPFGLDEFGRDVLSRVIHGSRVSLEVGIVAVTISLIIGTLLGALSGYLGGWVDIVIMRFADIFLAFPGLILAIGITAVLGQSIINVMAALAIVNWPGYARVVRGQVLYIKGLDYVEASRAMGASKPSILFGHVLPNSLAPIIVLATIGMGWAILAEAGLSFLGLGVRPPTPSWGSIIASGREFMFRAPHIATIPGIVLAVSILAFNIFGDGLRDALDPRLRV